MIYIINIILRRRLIIIIILIIIKNYIFIIINYFYYIVKSVFTFIIPIIHVVLKDLLFQLLFHLTIIYNKIV